MSEDYSFTSCPGCYIEIYSIVKALYSYSKGSALNTDMISIDIQFHDQLTLGLFEGLEMDIRH